MSERPDKDRWDAAQEFLQSLHEDIAQTLPDGVSAKRFTRAVWNSLRQQPRIVMADLLELRSPILQLAQLGLLPDTHARHAHLRPHGSGARVILGYRGMIAIALRSPYVVSVEAHVVYTADRFEHAHGTDQRLVHQRFVGDVQGRGERVCAYAIARLVDGALFHVSPLWEIEAARERSEDASEADSAWQTDTDAMWRKTPVRRLMPYLPVDAIEVDA